MRLYSGPISSLLPECDELHALIVLLCKCWRPIRFNDNKIAYHVRTNELCDLDAISANKC